MKHGYRRAARHRAPAAAASRMVGNLLAHSVERNPLSRARELVFVNNLVYDRVHHGLRPAERGRPRHQELGGGQRVPAGTRASARDTQAHLRAHHAAAYTLGSRQPRLRERQLRTGIRQLHHAAGRATPAATRSRACCRPRPRRCGTPASRRARPPTTRCTTACSATPARVPTDRDTVDKRIVRTSRTATAASSTASRRTAPPAATRMRAAGPRYAQNTRTLTLPSNPNTRGVERLHQSRELAALDGPDRCRA